MNLEKHKALTVLIIDDSEADRELYARLLSSDSEFEYTLLETWALEEAVALFKDSAPDCILVDFKLPGFTGLEVLCKLYEASNGKPVPAILLTGGGNEELAVEAMNSGAQEYLSKNSLTADSLRLAVHSTILKVAVENSRDRHLDELEAAFEREKKAGVAKTEFLANMSHEIRTPLNGALGFIDLVLEEVENETHREYLTLAHQSSEHLLSLINNILDLSKIEAGQFELEHSSFSLRPLLKAATEVCSVDFVRKNISVAWSIDEEIPNHLVGDKTRLTQIIVNLLGNALKFTPQGGEITLAARKSEETEGKVGILFSVTDNGIGIPQEKLAEIFKPFRQSDTTTTRYFGGTGLGLSIAEKCVKAFDGRIWVESEVGVGSTFFFEIMVESRSAEAMVPCEIETEYTIPEGKFLQIMVAEDNAVNQKLIMSLLSKAGHTVTIAADGEEALDLLNTKTFDIVLMDIHMPKLDGLEVAQRFREKEKLSNTKVPLPIIALTANAFQEDKRKALESGMSDFLAKPFRKDALFQAIHRGAATDKENL